jgi:hypothetical protein
MVASCDQAVLANKRAQVIRVVGSVFMRESGKLGLV